MLVDVMLLQKKGQGAKEMQVAEVDTVGNIKYQT